MITLNEIPYDWRVKGTYIEVRPTYVRKGLVPFPAKGILFVQKLASGSAVAKQKYEITRPEDGTALFGHGSVGQQMVRTFKKGNKTSRVFAIALDDDPAGVKGVWTLTFSGAGAGTIPIYIQGRRVRYKATSVMTPTQHAAAAVLAINADPDMPFVATSAVAVVTLTAKHAGEVGNQIDIRFRKSIEDVLPGTLAIAVAQTTPGSGNPDVQDILDVIANEWYTDIAMAWDDAANLEVFTEDMAERYKAMGKKDAHGYVGHRGTYGELGTKGNLTNSPFLSPIGAKKAFQAPWEWAAALCAACMFNLTNDPARQMGAVPLVGLDAPDDVDCFEETERNLLLFQGISDWARLDDGTVVLQRVITAYKKSILNVDDDAWLDIMVPKTMTRIRYDWSAYFTLLYPRHKLAPDDSIAAHNNDHVVTPKKAHGSWAARCQLYARQAWIIDVSRTVDESAFELDENNKNRLVTQPRVNIIGNLIQMFGALEFEA
ncbi:phage tail sheath subtilisin-like domain-containing protein [Bosea vestrisii]|uniref:Phage tail sheath subtilisin-like domain-containing protein n=1 Tax=Bosea vestrisii TaxID=151416 RepID=A0ABW0H948_9HYPH